MRHDDKTPPLLTRVVDVFLRPDVAVLLIVLSLALGAASLYLTPREEEPQIVVPMADVMVSAPGLSAEEVERQVTLRLEKLLYQIDGVEYVYSMSRPGACVVTVRFYVGEDREDSITKLFSKIRSNVDAVPSSVAGWVVRPVEVDDVPIVNVSLWSDRPEMYGDHELRRIAEQLQDALQRIRDTNRVSIVGGRPRKIRVELKPMQLASRQTTPLAVANAVAASNVNVHAGAFRQQDREWLVEAGQFVPDARALDNLVVHVVDGHPVYLKDVAEVIDGPAEIESHASIAFGPAAENPLDPTDRASHAENPASDRLIAAARQWPLPEGAFYPAVHIAVPKKKGSNAVRVARAVEEEMRHQAETILPVGVFYRITRNYGETANEKVNELVESLVIAVVTVIVLIGMVIGWRAALVIALAIPVCYSITLFVNLLAGYTINRVTLFALILSLGLLVDDPITDVENVARYFAMRVLPPRESVLRAIQEVQPALILSTVAIIASFLPLVFITGMMGPYMGPMAINVPLTVGVSTLVALTITPYLALFALRKLHDEAGKKKGKDGGDAEGFDITRRPIYRLSRAILGPVLDRRTLAWGVLASVLLLMCATAALPLFRLVPLKMLPYDNKNEFQIVVDMPEGTTLERTEAVTRQLATYMLGVSEVRDVQTYVGTASPMDFNGMVRHYFLRRGSHLADIRVNLAPKERRKQQSHVILLRLRNDLEEIAQQSGARIKLVEVPPGPPVTATITAEVYGPPESTHDELLAQAARVEARLAREPRIVDVDSTAEDDRSVWVFEVDQPKAALSGVSKDNLARTMRLALDGLPATVLHEPGEVDPLIVELRLPRSARSATDDLNAIYVQGETGQLVQLGALGSFHERPADKTIYHKNLRRLVFVYGEVAGRPPADAILDMLIDQEPDGSHPAPAATIRPADDRTWLSPGGHDPWAVERGHEVVFTGEGEWKITLDVFRDLGIAFAAAQVAIFMVLMFQTGSRLLPMVIMLAIPLTLIGIMPGFWLLNVLVDRPVGGYPNPVFFTATAMIGMIALGGIVVRNSVVLIEFIHQAVAEGLELREALIQSVAVRTRPIILTAGTTLLGNWVITLDPIFSGLAWAIIFGILTSTVFTLVVIPVVYWLLYGKKSAA